MMQDPVFRRPFGPDKLLPTPASAGDRFLQVQLNINMKWWKLPNPSFLSLRYGKLVPTTSRLISRAELASQPLSGRRAGSWRYSLQDSEGGGGGGGRLSVTSHHVEGASGAARSCHLETSAVQAWLFVNDVVLSLGIHGVTGG